MTSYAANELVVTDVVDGLLKVRLNDPDRLNAMSEEMKERFADVLALARDDGVRAVVITGTGRAFSAGGDVRTMEHGLRTPLSTRRRMQRAHREMVLALAELEKPTIAAVNGVAAGAGLGIALSCDLRIVSRDVKLVFAFNGLGLVPDFACGYFLPRIVGLGRAKELVLVKGRIRADEALSIGLVTEVVDNDACLDRALEIGGLLASGPTAGLGLGKRLLDLSYDNSLANFLDLESAYQSVAASTDDHKNARRAFLAKQVATFTGE
ncbi:enoyl-CoA hydratase/isomerase family protein [Streptomyces canus]|uniref:enoyl-CoA hydratase/isomerase family protein n=1 Tax=Streptomyces canus TaxID=58343 RepID=UPI00369A2B24